MYACTTAPDLSGSACLCRRDSRRNLGAARKSGANDKWRICRLSMMRQCYKPGQSSARANTQRSILIAGGLWGHCARDRFFFFRSPWRDWLGNKLPHAGSYISQTLARNGQSEYHYLCSHWNLFLLIRFDIDPTVATVYKVDIAYTQAGSSVSVFDAAVWTKNINRKPTSVQWNWQFLFPSHSKVYRPVVFINTIFGWSFFVFLGSSPVTGVYHIAGHWAARHNMAQGW